MQSDLGTNKPVRTGFLSRLSGGSPLHIPSCSLLARQRRPDHDWKDPGEKYPGRAGHPTCSGMAAPNWSPPLPLEQTIQRLCGRGGCSSKAAPPAGVLGFLHTEGAADKLCVHCSGSEAQLGESETGKILYEKRIQVQTFWQ